MGKRSADRLANAIGIRTLSRNTVQLAVRSTRWRGGRVVDGGGLENRCAPKGLERFAE